jgi:hypothetical protein
MNKIESAYKEMMEDVQMSGEMIAYCMKDKALELERELIAVTEQRDQWKDKYIQQNKDLGYELRDPNGTIWSECKRLQTELDVVTKQRDKIDLMYHKIIKEVLECDPIPACKRKDDQLEPPWEVIARVREQRDRLAEALKNISSGIYAWHTCVDKLAPEALLLTPNEL